MTSFYTALQQEREEGKQARAALTSARRPVVDSRFMGSRATWAESPGDRREPSRST